MGNFELNNNRYDEFLAVINKFRNHYIIFHLFACLIDGTFSSPIINLFMQVNNIINKAYKSIITIHLGISYPIDIYKGIPVQVYSTVYISLMMSVKEYT